MNNIVSELVNSPSKVGNFLLTYSNEAEIVQNIETESLVQFLDNQRNSSLQALCDTDQSYFPRAFTDVDLVDVNEAVPPKILSDFGNDLNDPRTALIDNSNSGADSRTSMAARNNNGVGNNFQPDVILSNSHQRSGPDGSPALVPTGSQGFIAANMSETGELFAPVRTLTFSDIDQSSHIEDSYVNNSRLVSTPNRDDQKPNHYDYSGMQSGGFQIGNDHAANTQQDESDSSDSEYNILNGAHGRSSPEFRQLEGEAESDLQSTGPFHPSAHGLSKEFMDQFVGKTSNPGFPNPSNGNIDIFSPLGSNAFRLAEQRMQSSTPPLHSPGPNSPYAKYAKGSPGNQRSQYHQSSHRMRQRDDSDEIQFQMSPSRGQPDVRPINREVIGYGTYPETSMAVQNHGDFYNHMSNVDYSFRPIELQQPVVAPKNVPKNLNEYFDEHNKAPFSPRNFHSSINANGTGQQIQRDVITQGEDNDLELDSRQGDGSDSDGDEGSHRIHVHKQPIGSQQAVFKSPPPLDQRYLQRTQVSIKLPQPTYDTISADTSHDDKFSPGNHLHQTHGGVDCTSDLAGSGATGDGGNTDNVRTSPGKVMDLLKNQSETSQPSHSMVDRTDATEKLTAAKTSHPVTNKVKDSIVLDSKPHDPMHGQIQGYSGVGSHNSRIDIPKFSMSNPNQSSSGAMVISSNNSQINKQIGMGIQGQDQTMNQVSSQPQVTSLPSSSQSQVLIQASSQSQAPLQTSNQSQVAVSSRLLQETVSQRNKTTQKYVSTAPNLVKVGQGQSAPNIAKPGQGQSKDFKKPLEVPPKNPTGSQGARKILLNDTNQKFKVSDKVKPKLGSTENVSVQRQRNVPANSRNSTDNGAVPQSRNIGNPMGSQSYHGQGYRGQMSTSRGEGQGHDGSAHSIEDGGECTRLVTQVQTTSPVRVEQAEQTIGPIQGKGESSLDIRGMEEVRHQLQSMMRMSHLSPQERSQYEHSDILAGFGVEFGDQPRNVDMSWNLMRKPDEEMLENFPSMTSQYFTDSGNVSRSDASVHAENQRLRDMLEKERYRRKHCEQYIQQLNVKLLETQQQVAVAVSTDKRKDIMIEQLDKQLARVMEGWKKRDQEKDEMVEEIQREKQEIQNQMTQQQQMINNFEADMSEAVEALRQEKETAAHSIQELNCKVKESERSKGHAVEMLDAEKEKVDLLEQECVSLREGRETLDKKLDQMQRRLHREQDDWFQREQELLQRIEEVSEKNTKILQLERAKNEEQSKLADEIMDQYQAATTHVKKLEMELDAAVREKDSVRVEMGIMEAKFENAQRVLEADMHSTMEKQIADQIADVQKRHEKAVDEIHEKHREQMLELSQRNGQEMEKQLSVFREEMLKKEEEFRKQTQDMENRLTEYRNENSELKRSKQKLESTRLEILTKLQYAMQSQWNEALSLLSATPHRKHTQSHTPAAEDDGSTSVTSQSVPAVNFSFYSPFKPPANQDTHSTHQSNQATPPRQPPSRSTNQTSPKTLSANQLSPVQRHSSNQDQHSVFSPGRDSVISHSTEKDHDDASIETATLSHLKQFQDYMNSFTKTPEWIASINSHLDTSSGTAGAHGDTVTPQLTPRLPSPPEIAALLSMNLRSIQQQQLMPHPPTSVNQSAHSMSQPNSLLDRPHPPTSISQSGHSMSQPNSLLANHRHLDNSEQSASLPPSLTNITHRQSEPVTQTVTPPLYNQSAYQIEMSHSNLNQTDLTVYSDVTNQNSEMHQTSALWEGASGISRAVPIRPPQQCDDPYMNDDQQSVVSAVSVGPTRGYFQGGQSFSPPTKQQKDSQNNSVEDLSHQTNRLNEDYSELSERLEEHETHQNDLQHYIQILLNRSPGEVTNNQNDSMFSQDNEELDLNDTAQAAQLQRELDRIQELRRKQESASKDRGQATQATQNNTKTQSHPDSTENKILSQEQLTEVTRLLNQVKGQGQKSGASQPNSSAVTELLELLKHTQAGNENQSDFRRGQKHSPRIPTGHHGDRNKTGAPGVRRNVQFHPGKGVEVPKQGQDAAKTDKPTAKAPSQPSQAKKVERKVAGSAVKGEKAPKPAAWK